MHPPVITIDHALGTPMRENLKQYFLQASSTVAGKQSNMPGGQSYFENKWLSANNLHKSQNALIQTASNSILEIVNRFAVRHDQEPFAFEFTSLWVLVSSYGMEGKPHSHQGHLSGAYYINAAESGDKSCGGEFMVIDPEQNDSHSFQPRSDRLLLFPSNTIHQVRRYTGKSRRITMSFNLKRVAIGA